MSTAFYRLRDPISSLRVDAEGEHVRLTVWVEGKNVGSLTLDDRTLSPVLMAFATDYDHQGAGDAGQTVLRTGGHLYEDTAWPDSMQLVDEYGMLTTLGEVRATMKKEP